MNHRDPRPYVYDDQTTAYPSGQLAPQTDHYSTAGYAYDSSSHYYAAPSHGMGNIDDAASTPSPYFRSMTPSLSSHRYPNGSRDPRYPGSQGFVASSSSMSQPIYPQTSQYTSQYLPMSDQNTTSINHTPQQPRFIPTPSQIAHAYSTYPQPISTASVQDDLYGSSSLDYPAPPHVVPSSTGNSHRPSRIITGRPRNTSGNGSSPTSAASSPSGERFPCEKCGKTFSRSHDRKRHYETQHLPSPVIHRCVYCHKEFSRADSLKRHLDNGCDEMRS